MNLYYKGSISGPEDRKIEPWDGSTLYDHITKVESFCGWLIYDVAYEYGWAEATSFQFHVTGGCKRILKQEKT